MDQKFDEKDYYIVRKPDLLKEFHEDMKHWRPILINQFGSDLANIILEECSEEYEALIPQIPYIGGDESWTGSLIESVECLAFYKAMKKHGKTAEETGKILYDAILAQIHESQTSISPGEGLTPDQLMERRKKRAGMSQKRRYVEGYKKCNPRFKSGRATELKWPPPFVK